MARPHLKMSEHRFGILNSKKVNLIKQQKREIAELLRGGKEEKARIRVEHLIRLDFTIEATHTHTTRESGVLKKNRYACAS